MFLGVTECIAGSGTNGDFIVRSNGPGTQVSGRISIRTTLGAYTWSAPDQAVPEGKIPTGSERGGVSVASWAWGRASGIDGAEPISMSVDDHDVQVSKANDGRFRKVTTDDDEVLGVVVWQATGDFWSWHAITPAGTEFPSCPTLPAAVRALLMKPPSARG